ncbi:MAG: Ger(x)C family spore germination protein, partial [Ignavibacteriales bacterium]
MYKRLLIVPLILCLLLSGGCWDRKEVNQSVMVLGEGIDLAKNDQILFTIQMPLAQQSPNKSGKDLPFTSVSAIDQTTVSAARRIALESPRTVLWQHSAIIVFGEEICKKGLSGLIDLQARNRNVRKTEQFLVARNSRAADILAVPTPLQDIPAVGLASMLKVQDQILGLYTSTLLDDFIRRSADPGIEPSAPGVTIVRPAQGQSYLELSGTAVFKKGKLVGWLNTEESRGYRWLRPK